MEKPVASNEFHKMTAAGSSKDQDYLDANLYFACFRGEAEEAKKYIGLGANMSYVHPEDGFSPLHKSVQMKNSALVVLLAESGADLNMTTSHGDRGWPAGLTPLMLARANASMTELLLRHGADPDIQETENRRSAMHLAAMANEVGTVQVLVRHDARRDLVDRYGKTPLEYAVNLGAQSVERFLTAYDAAERAHSTVTEKDPVNPRPL